MGMDQQGLRQWESRCIQDEPPFCQAACPLRVDGRAFIGQLARGDLDAARKTIERSLPLPGVLGRVCEAPCEAACKRREAGEALRIGALERLAVTHGKPGPRPLRLPAKKGRALILGGGMAALVCAWDLLRKGWKVELRTLGAPLGGALAALPAELLPPEALADGLATLSALGLAPDTSPGGGQEALERALAQALAATSPGGEPCGVFLEHGFSPDTDAACAARAAVDPVTLAGNAPGLFVGGWPFEPGRPARFVDAAADGRRAASSLDRLLSGASLTAGREKEGATGTRLFTSLAGVEPLPREPLPRRSEGGGEELEWARREAARCLQCQCLECVRVCAYLEKHKSHPRAYTRQIYNNAAIVKGQHLANRLINSCSLCGLCAKVCPEGFDMAELCLSAREDMVARGVMPQSAHEFALEDMADACGPDFALALPDPASGTCAQAFFPGCQLCASHPHHVEAVFGHLRRHLPGGTGLMLRCCGIPAHWAGREELFRKAAEEFAQAWSALGRPRMVVACSGCLSVLRRPEYRQAAPGLEAVSLWETLAALPLPEPLPRTPDAPLALHEPCTARDDASYRRSARAVAAALGLVLEEPSLSGELTECCGFGGLMSQVDAPLGRAVARRRAGASQRDFVACCAMCRDRFAAEGKRTWHLLDFMFPAHPGLCGAGQDPALAPGPGFSARQEGRAALKSGLLSRVWGQSPPGQDAGPALDIGLDVAVRLDERRILASDLRRALAQGLESGRLLRDEESGRVLVSHRPRRVTFWAELEPLQPEKGGGHRLLNAWSHRMVVPGAGGAQEEAAASGQGQNRVDQTYLPARGRWSCAACGEALAPRPVVASYLGSVFTISLLGCARCGQTLVPEDLALGRMFEVEQLLEDK